MPIFKKFYNEADIKKQNELVSIQERLETKDKETVNEIKKRNLMDIDDTEKSTENITKKMKTEAEQNSEKNQDNKNDIFSSLTTGFSL